MVLTPELFITCTSHRKYRDCKTTCRCYTREGKGESEKDGEKAFTAHQLPPVNVKVSFKLTKINEMFLYNSVSFKGHIFWQVPTTTFPNKLSFSMVLKL